MKRMLERRGYQITIAIPLSQAGRNARTEFELVISDRIARSQAATN